MVCYHTTFLLPHHFSVTTPLFNGVILDFVTNSCKDTFNAPLHFKNTTSHGAPLTHYKTRVKRRIHCLWMNPTKGFLCWLIPAALTHLVNILLYSAVPGQLRYLAFLPKWLRIDWHRMWKEMGRAFLVLLSTLYKRNHHRHQFISQQRVDSTSFLSLFMSRNIL